MGVDSTTLEANAAMKSIVRRDTGEDWKQYVTRLMREDGTIEPDARADRRRGSPLRQKAEEQACRNEDWVSPTDPDSRITKMKDGRTHLAYKAEHVVDLESDMVLAAEIRPADQADTADAGRQRDGGAEQLGRRGSEREIEEVAADKGYHADAHVGAGRRPGIADLHSRAEAQASPALDRQAGGIPTRRVCQPPSHEAGQEQTLAAAAERTVERTFAHVCDTGGMRRSWLKGVAKLAKRYLIAVAAHNLGRILRKLFGIGKPKALQGEGGLAALAYLLAVAVVLVGADCWRRESAGTVGWVGLTG